ncbi:hypothetical protein NIIDMKKI_47260 [Mycobacterium kansasii]|uniref:Dienelactone hydrolase domain-containing protein n=1 Tax=Mycobacterium kansasii TaxID=1768 RepID=A0A7G1IFC5_MYCKA|nr:hypothetical protein NIIDMKKI_47260 [Mycobacterium kansasii]
MPKLTDTVTTPDGSCPVHLFTPDGAEGPWPGVVMYPDAGGVRETFYQMAAKLAGNGYAVLLPDVYYREGAWAAFDMATAFGDAKERARIMFMIGTLTPDRVTRDSGAFFDYLSGRPEVRASASVCAATAWVDGSRWWSPVALGTGSPPRRRFTAAAWSPTAQTARICWPSGCGPRSMWAARRTTRRSPLTTPNSSTKL